MTDSNTARPFARCVAALDRSFLKIPNVEKDLVAVKIVKAADSEFRVVAVGEGGSVKCWEGRSGNAVVDDKIELTT